MAEGPGAWAHKAALTAATAVDEQVGGWLEQAYQLALRG